MTSIVRIRKKIDIVFQRYCKRFIAIYKPVIMQEIQGYNHRGKTIIWL